MPLLPFFLLYIFSEARNRREKVRGLPGAGTVGEMIVLSGSRELDANTWFPVPREGVLGSVRSCDLVVPCPGVRAKHLDFFWKDGTGLLIRPRTGCEALINGIPITCRTDAASVPLTHGGILQVGSALLRLHLFAALDNTASPDQPQSVEMHDPYPSFIPDADSYPVQESSMYNSYGSPESPFRSVPESCPLPEGTDSPCENESGQLHRSDRWKEDLGE